MKVNLALLPETDVARKAAPAWIVATTLTIYVATEELRRLLLSPTSSRNY
jgi:hypothetical protein